VTSRPRSLEPASTVGKRASYLAGMARLSLIHVLRHRRFRRPGAQVRSDRERGYRTDGRNNLAGPLGGMPQGRPRSVPPGPSDLPFPAM
jgi:hypothetical protein